MYMGKYISTLRKVGGRIGSHVADMVDALPRLPEFGVYASQREERPEHRGCQEVSQSNARPVDAC
jgi:hypothetical protein